jgi:hypothetical protein
MANTVFANKMEVSCKESGGKSIAAFPDVCFTPPTAPPTPPGVPIPYPNTSMASDTDQGSKQVSIGGKQVMLKDQSDFKKSLGDQAGCAPKKGVITSTNGGKSYFTSWSMDVKVQGENVVRNFDMTTHNHASKPGQTPPWVHVSTLRPGKGSAKCTLQPYNKKCPKGQTGHHCVPDHCFKAAGPGGKPYPGAVPHKDGLCICVSGATKSSGKAGGFVKKAGKSDPKHFAALAEHGRIHKVFDMIEAKLGAKGVPPNTAKLGDLEDAAAEVISVVTGCDEKDIKKQLRNYHKKRGLKADTKLRADPFGRKPNPPSAGMGNVQVSNMPG